MKASAVLKRPATASARKALERSPGPLRHIEEPLQDDLSPSELQIARPERHVNIMFVQNLHTGWAFGEHQGQDLHLFGASHEPDALTTFYHRYLFQECLIRELSRAERFGSQLTLVRCHLVKGTSPKLRKRVSLAFGRACDASLRRYDYAGRLSNNEFAVLLPEADRFGAQAVVQRITEALEQALSPCTGWALRVGMACFPFDGETVEALLTATAANEILYGGCSRQAELNVQA
ncbi:MAG: GGDEF domain-containing protein [Nitrospiraceae bacterium]